VPVWANLTWVLRAGLLYSSYSTFAVRTTRARAPGTTGPLKFTVGDLQSSKMREGNPGLRQAHAAWASRTRGYACLGSIPSAGRATRGRKRALIAVAHILLTSPRLRLAVTFQRWSSTSFIVPAKRLTESENTSMGKAVVARGDAGNSCLGCGSASRRVLCPTTPFVTHSFVICI